MESPKQRFNDHLDKSTNRSSTPAQRAAGYRQRSDRTSASIGKSLPTGEEIRGLVLAAPDSAKRTFVVIALGAVAGSLAALSRLDVHRSIVFLALPLFVGAALGTIVALVLNRLIPTRTQFGNRVALVVTVTNLRVLVHDLTTLRLSQRPIAELNRAEVSQASLDFGVGDGASTRDRLKIVAANSAVEVATGVLARADAQLLVAELTELNGTLA
jgi:hypothetical protein